MIEIAEQFDVPDAPPRAVWNFLSDREAVVSCVAGASLGEQHEDGTFDGGLMIKFGPAKVTFRARIALELDDAAMTGRVSSRGKDKQGGTRFTAAMTFRVMQRTEGRGSVVQLTGRNKISGKLAGLVESGAKVVVKRMTADFAHKLAARCSEITNEEGNA